MKPENLAAALKLISGLFSSKEDAETFCGHIKSTEGILFDIYGADKCIQVSFNNDGDGGYVINISEQSVH